MTKKKKWDPLFGPTFWSHALVPRFGPTFCGDLVKIGRESKREPKIHPMGFDPTSSRSGGKRFMRSAAVISYYLRVKLLYLNIKMTIGPTSQSHFSVPLSCFKPLFAKRPTFVSISAALWYNYVPEIDLDMIVHFP